MKPIVDVYKLGRTSYAKTLELQRFLFEELKSSSTSLIRRPNETHKSNYNNIVSPTSSSKIISSISLNEPNNNGVQSNQSHLINYGFQQQHSSLRSSLILVEHEPVYTVGLRTALYDDDYVSKLKHKLREHRLEAEFYHTNRGGLITFHGPGQLVAYPILNLTEFSNSVKGGSVRVYVNLLECTIIDTLRRMGLPDAHTIREYPGVWVDNGERKVAFIGITCKRRITMHGISINCDCDLNWFDFIVSCGIEEKQITSIRKELLRGSSNEHVDPGASSSIHHKSNLKKHNTQCEADAVGSVCSVAADLNQMTQSNTIELHTSVEDVAKEFCQAFSRRFDCILENVPEVCEAP